MDDPAYDFSLSWDKNEKRYTHRRQVDRRREFGDLIQEMRAMGYDKKLRAGHSLFTLILSRSRLYGYVGIIPQPIICFDIIPEGVKVRYLNPDDRISEVEFVFPEVKLNDEIIVLLHKLSVHPIVYPPCHPF